MKYKYQFLSQSIPNRFKNLSKIISVITVAISIYAKPVPNVVVNTTKINLLPTPSMINITLIPLVYKFIIKTCKNNYKNTNNKNYTKL